MPRLTKTTTRRGDDGLTDLSTGERISKGSLRIRAIGTLDELNSAIGLALSLSPQAETTSRLRRIQNELFHLGSMLSRGADGPEKKPGPQIEQRHIDSLEEEIRSLLEQLGLLENFLLPNGTPCAAALHLARAVCRRAERELVALAGEEKTDHLSLVYLNRLSDFLFLESRWENKANAKSEVFWDSRL